MGIGTLLSEYGVAVGSAAVCIIALPALFALLSRLGIARRPWGVISSRPIATGLLAFALLAAVFVATFSLRLAHGQRDEHLQQASFATQSNLLYGASFMRAPITGTLAASRSLSETVAFDAPSREVDVKPQSLISSHVLNVRSGAVYHYSLYTAVKGEQMPVHAQLRFLWLNSALDVVSHNDTQPWLVQGDTFAPNPPNYRFGSYTAPASAAHLVFQVWNTNPLYTTSPETSSNSDLSVMSPQISESGVVVEPNPNGTQGSVAFSFDWESAMGGAVHSQGAEQHDVAAAADHGMHMRQGADWLNRLFVSHDIRATFYATGYNLLDGNTERRLFEGNPTFAWPKPKNNWQIDYWTKHPWFSDDPFGTYKTDPAWYFGDQTRALLAAGHEIAPHTFAHIYVRGSNPAELGLDMDEWLAAGRAAGVPAPTTFAFPWRSSNSVKADMYSVLWKRGITTVTRLYARDVRDQYTLAAVPTYPAMSLMPDFLLGSPSANSGEEAGGAEIGLEEGLRVLDETAARRGTTSFWTHPEQLASDPSLDRVRTAWSGVVARAATMREHGRLWIGTVAQIANYQRGVMSVTTELEPGFLNQGAWQLRINNNSGTELHGVTLTLPGSVLHINSGDAQIQTVSHPDANTVVLSKVGAPFFPARQIVLPTLKPGQSTLQIEWTPGEEPPGW